MRAAEVFLIADFPKGAYAHVRGIRFALARKGYLALTAIPFVLTALLFVGAFTLFAANGDRLLELVWTPGQAEAGGGILAVLYWLYVHVAKFVLSLLAFVLMYYLFMVTANILASPLYDHIAARLAREARGGPADDGAGLSLWRTVLEELKKAVFVAAVPMALFFVPIIGQLLAPVAAALLLAFDFVDFSLCRDQPRFAGRLRYLARHPLLLLGFGLPLLLPIVNLFLYPFAILGASLLYQEASGHVLPASRQDRATPPASPGM